jgi:hypothetical protein
MLISLSVVRSWSNAVPKFWTHKGWRFFCPCYFADIEKDCMVVDMRHWIFWPLWQLAELLEGSIILFLTIFDPDYVPAFMFYVTGELEPEKYPITWEEGVCKECGDPVSECGCCG